MRKFWKLIVLVTAATLSSAATEVPKKCPQNNSNGRTIHLPHEWDCEKFYKCDHGKPVLFLCPIYSDTKRLYFNPVLEVCDWPESSGCVPGPRPTPTEGSISSTPVIQTTVSTHKPTWEPIANSTSSSGRPTKPTNPTTTTVPTLVTSKTPTDPPAETTSPSETPKTTSKLPVRPTPSSQSTPKVSTITAVTTSPTTAEVDQENTPDPSDNRLPHESNCSLFYEVVNNKKILRQCPPKLFFSPYLRYCLPFVKARCSSTTLPPIVTTVIVPEPANCGDINDGWVVPHECVCSRYYLCSNGNLIRKDCPSGLHFDKTLHTCGIPESAGCETTTTTTVTTPSTTVIIPTECPPDNSGPLVQIPHPTNCSLYYQCDNGNMKLQKCPDDLHFNPILQRCDWADSAGCRVNSTITTIAETVVTPVVTIPDVTDVGGTTVGKLPTACPADNSMGTIRLPYPGNCSLFYACDMGKKVVMSCPESLHFNAITQECDWSALAGCVEETTVTTASTGTTRTTPVFITQDPIDSTTEDPSQPTDVTNEVPAGPTDSPVLETSLPTETTVHRWTTRPSESTRPSPCLEGSKLPHPTNCSLYYKCENGENTIKQCTEGLQFNPILSICDWWEFAGCTAEISTSSGTTRTTPVSITQDPIDSTTEGPSQSTDVTTEVPAEPTDSPALETSLPAETTVHKWTTRPSESTRPSACLEGAKLPYPTNCSLYYKCENGEITIKQCTEGLQFNPILSICDWWAFAGCTAETLESLISTTILLPNITKTPNNDYPGQATMTKPTTIRPTVGPSDCIGVCPSRDPMDRTVLLANQDCTKFCSCSNGRAYVFDCPASLHFNPTTLVCDSPRRAKCVGTGGTGQSDCDDHAASGSACPQ